MTGPREFLETQFARLEAERGLIEEAIAEVKRRFEGSDDVESWNLLGQKGTRLEQVPNPTLGFDGGIDRDALNKPGFLA